MIKWLYGEKVVLVGKLYIWYLWFVFMEILEVKFDDVCGEVLFDVWDFFGVVL